MEEIRSVNRYDEIKYQGKGYFFITDSGSRNVVHKVGCRCLNRLHFLVKTVMCQNRNGRYYYGNDVNDFDIIGLKKTLCRKCRPMDN